MPRGLDYSFAHPDVHCVARSGWDFVARYVGDPDPNSAKYLDFLELTRIRVVGLSVVVVRETTAGFMVGGDGAAHARASRAHCDALGLDGIPIYYALDVDPRGLTAGQIAEVTRFLQDAADADGGGHNVGLYGAHAAIERWVGQPFCWFGWQTYAWSGGRISSKAHLRQYLNGQHICGGTVDLNETYAPDFGQWPRPAKQAGGPIPKPPITEDEDVFYVRVIDDGTGTVGLGGPGYWKHVDDQDELAALQRQRGNPRDVTRADYDQLRAACLHGERCANDATS